VDEFIRISERLMRCPAAPYHEQLVADEVVRICSENGLAFSFDAYGNILVSLVSDRKARSLVLAAHMDHPAFVIRSRLKGGELKSDFLGGVGEKYFPDRLELLLMPGRVPARLNKCLSKTKKQFLIKEESRRLEKPQYAVWALKDFELSDGRIYGRACDDLIGVAAALTTLIQLKRSNRRVNVVAAISRAEEVGFQGALALVRSKILPKSSLIISLETSRELPGVKMGDGVIIRVGDRASIFDSDATRFLSEAAADLAKKNSKFKFQRALMSGGTCEGTAYQEYGFQTAAACMALGNYHNCADNNLIREEFVSVNDGVAMVDLLCAAATEMKNFNKLKSRLTDRLEKLSREALQNLRKHRLNKGNGARRKSK
jgi:putative aminopeptidase FrvX